jgi:hypothetical protein
MDDMREVYYIIGIEHKDGSQKYLRGQGDGIDNPGLAKTFAFDAPKSELIDWISKIRIGATSSQYGNSLANYNLDTIRILVYTVDINPIDSDDIEWKTLLQRSALKKLLKMEIEALGLEKYEIERRLAIPDDDDNYGGPR